MFMIESEQMAMIESRLYEKYPEIDSVVITKLTNSKKYGNSIAYFKALVKMTQNDFEAELDEDGNYPQKSFEVSGIMEGSLFKSSLDADYVDQENIPQQTQLKI